MITAIITKLKTGTITNVVAKGDGVANLVPPYIVVWEDVRTVTGNAQTTGGYYISCHVNKGALNVIDEYLNNEIITLLHKVVLTDSLGNKFRLEDTGELSILVESNDDGTISKDRLFLLPKLGAV